VTAISLHGLTKVYATGVKALDALDLDVDDGEFVVLVGPSGCGKTTALRLVAGLEMITSGTVSIGGRVVNDVSPRHRDVAMVFQNYALYPHMSVHQNIGFALENKKVDKAERDRRVRAAASVLGISDLLGRKPRQLSGGQRQRVAMGRAIVRSPSVFLMDEPLSNLDAKLRVQMRSEVLRVHRSLEAATLYVTHDQVEAMTMGDRVAVLRAGVLQQYDTPQSLYDRPANVFVATFIGSPPMNLYEAGLSADGLSEAGLSEAGPSADGPLGAAGTPTAVLGSQRLALPPQTAAGLAGYQGRKIIVGIRPEHLHVAGPVSEPGPEPGSGGPAAGPGRAAAAPGRLVADVHGVEALGSEQQVYFSVDATPVGNPAAEGISAAEGILADQGILAGEGILAGGAPNGVARVDPRAAVRAGTRVTFAVDAARLHFFDPDTGSAVG
jgi:multiple sugar transport system ATP-binding protein